MAIQRFDYIDALRAYAIMGVVLTHVTQWVIPVSGIFQGVARLGNYGVQLFFLTSALTLFMSFKVRNGQEMNSTIAFYIRRFFRITPMFYLALVAYQMYNIIAFETLVPKTSPWWHYVVTSLFLHGWHPETINSIVPGCWSIAVEMTFYLCLPALFLFLTTLKRTLYFFFISIIVSKALSFVMNAILHRLYFSSYELYLYYWYFSQLPVFILGIGLYQITERLKKNEDRTFGLFLIVVSIFLYFTFINYSCWGNLIPQHLVYGLIFCIFAAGISVCPLRLFVNKLVTVIGKISFSIYLTHFMILDAFKKLCNGAFPIQGDIGCISAFFSVLAVAIIVSLFTYFIIEKPGIKLGNYLISKA